MAECSLNTMFEKLDFIDQCLTEEQIQGIKEWKKYSADMIVYCEELLNDGFANGGEPTRPKTTLNTILHGAKTKASALDGDSLHDYLRSKLIDGSFQNIESDLTFTTLGEMTRHMKIGYQNLCRANSTGLRVALDYGHYLNVAYTLHENEKLKGLIKGTWKAWLENNVGIKDSYARKLRTVSALLHDYPRFKGLGLTFHEVYTMRQRIHAMLQGRNAEYWRSEQCSGR